MNSNTFVSEICFDSRIGRICFPIGTGPTFPSTQDLDVHKSELKLSNGLARLSLDGEIMEAFIKCSSEELSFENTTERERDKTVKVFSFKRNEKEFFSLRAIAPYSTRPTLEEACNGNLSIQATAENFNYDLSVKKKVVRSFNLMKGRVTIQVKKQLTSFQSRTIKKKRTWVYAMLYQMD